MLLGSFLRRPSGEHFKHLLELSLGDQSIYQTRVVPWIRSQRPAIRLLVGMTAFISILILGMTIQCHYSTECDSFPRVAAAGIFFGIILVVVSHVNDFGQTRGSRYLGKVCDLRIDLTRETGAENPILRRTVNISIPYGRFCSNAGPVGSYLFDPLTQKYVEAANDNDTHGFGDREAA
jgi:hypothetical protein